MLGYVWRDSDFFAWGGCSGRRLGLGECFGAAKLRNRLFFQHRLGASRWSRACKCGLRGTFSEFALFFGAELLIGLPLNFTLLGREAVCGLTVLREVLASSGALLRTQRRPFPHAGVHFGLLCGRQLRKILGHALPFALLACTESIPIGREWAQRGLLHRAEIAPSGFLAEVWFGRGCCWRCGCSRGGGQCLTWRLRKSPRAH